MNDLRQKKCENPFGFSKAFYPGPHEKLLIKPVNMNISEMGTQAREMTVMNVGRLSCSLEEGEQCLTFFEVDFGTKKVGQHWWHLLMTQCNWEHQCVGGLGNHRGRRGLTLTAMFKMEWELVVNSRLGTNHQNFLLWDVTAQEGEEGEQYGHPCYQRVNEGFRMNPWCLQTWLVSL